jgi:DNA-binding transcriptional ArsR family regulator
MDALAALAEPRRREILRLVSTGELPAGEIAQRFEVSRPAISQHLRVLKDAGLVADRRDGNRRLYAVDPRGIETMRAYFDTFWGDALAAFKQAAERKGAG